MAVARRTISRSGGKAPPLRKECFRLPDNPAHDLGGVWQVVDKTRCLSCDHGRRIEVALFPSFGVAPGLFLNILHQLHLSPKSLLGMGVTEHPSGKRGRSYVPPRDIEKRYCERCYHRSRQQSSAWLPDGPQPPVRHRSAYPSARLRLRASARPPIPSHRRCRLRQRRGYWEMRRQSPGPASASYDWLRAHQPLSPWATRMWAPAAAASLA